MTELLPCPFCGSSKLFVYQDEWGCSEVECDDCKCQGPFAPHEKGLSEEAHLDLARVAWNKRAPRQIGELTLRVGVHTAYDE